MTEATRTPRKNVRLRRWLRVLRRVVGAPDYEAYLAHCRDAGHPPTLSEREFAREFFDRKGQNPRCC